MAIRSRQGLTVNAFRPSSADGLPPALTNWDGEALTLFAFGFSDPLNVLGLKPGDVLAAPGAASQQSLGTVIESAQLQLRLDASGEAVTPWVSSSGSVDIGAVRLVDTRPSRCSEARVLVKDSTEIVDFKSTLVLSSTLAVVGGAWPMKPGKPALIGLATRSGPRASATELTLREAGVPGGVVTSLAYDGLETVYAAVLTATTSTVSSRVLELDRAGNLRREIFLPDEHALRLTRDGQNHVYAYSPGHVAQLFPTPSPPLDRTAEYPTPILSLLVVRSDRRVVLDDEHALHVYLGDRWVTEYRTTIDFPPMEAADRLAGDDSLLLAHSSSHLWIRGEQGWALLPSDYPSIGHESVVPLGMGSFLLTGTNDLKAIYDPRSAKRWCSINDSGTHQALFASLSLDRRTAFAVDDYCPLPKPPFGGCTPPENGRIYWIDLVP